jgi:hypothetical protein
MVEKPNSISQSLGKACWVEESTYNLKQSRIFSAATSYPSYVRDMQPSYPSAESPSWVLSKGDSLAGASAPVCVSSHGNGSAMVVGTAVAGPSPRLWIFTASSSRCSWALVCRALASDLAPRTHANPSRWHRSHRSGGSAEHLIYSRPLATPVGYRNEI